MTSTFRTGPRGVSGSFVVAAEWPGNDSRIAAVTWENAPRSIPCIPRRVASGGVQRRTAAYQPEARQGKSPSSGA